MKIVKTVFIVVAAISAGAAAAVEFGFVVAQPLKIAIFAVLVVDVAGWAFLGVRELRLEGFRDIRIIMTKALDMACITIAQGTSHTFRSNIFMPDGRHGNRLAIRFHSSNMTKAKDLGIRLEKWQGSTGNAWGCEAPVVADLTLAEVEGGARWGLDENCVKMTSGLQAVFSIPVRHPTKPDQLVAILNFDTEEPIAGFLKEHTTQEVALEIASQIGSLLYAFDPELQPLE